MRTKPAYQPRLADTELALSLAATGAVVLEGPRACGKTATARQQAASEVLLDVDTAARETVRVDPSLILEGPVPRLIDEWQLEPAIWNHIRRAVDDRRTPGQFILTGSAVPTDDITRHTGAGRITRVRMRPMTLSETGHSNGTISLADLLNGDQPRCPDPGLTVPDLAERIAVGGWPGHLVRDLDQSLRTNRDYLDEVRRVDIERVDGVRRDPNRVGRLLRSLARNVATYATATKLAAEAAGADEALQNNTVSEYLDALGRLMIVEDQLAWAPHLRSRSVLRSGPKRHFIDPSLAVAALRSTPARLLRDMNLLGFLFESLVIRDLRVYAQASDAQIFQYRDNTGLEVDAIVECADGRWIALEVKLGPGQVDTSAKNLRRFADRVDTSKSGEPVLLGVVVGFGFGYVREDGVAVIPIGALRH